MDFVLSVNNFQTNKQMSSFRCSLWCLTSKENWSDAVRLVPSTIIIADKWIPDNRCLAENVVGRQSERNDWIYSINVMRMRFIRSMKTVIEDVAGDYTFVTDNNNEKKYQWQDQVWVSVCVCLVLLTLVRTYRNMHKHTHTNFSIQCICIRMAEHNFRHKKIV